MVLCNREALWHSRTYASLFTECVECLDLTTKVCKLNIIKRQCMVWGESIGLLSPDEGRDHVLDQLKGRQEIKDVLQQISILFQDVEELKTRYGVEVDITNDDGQPHCIAVSRRRRDIFKQQPIVGFLSRLATHQRKSTIITKTRHAALSLSRYTFILQINILGFTRIT